MKENNKNNHFGYINEYLASAFKKLNKSQSEIINDLNKSQPYVSALMSGKKKVGKEIAKQLSNLYGFDEGSILIGSEIKTTRQKQLTQDIDTFDFKVLSIEEKLNKLFEQNNRILEEYSEIKNILNKSTLDNQDHKNIIVDYIDLSLQPIIEFIGATKKQKENK